MSRSTSMAASEPSVSLACDCHLHVYDGRYPTDPRATLKPADATVADYRAIQTAIGSSRAIVVQPSTYGTDNRCTLAAVKALGDGARCVVVVDPDIGDDELQAIHHAGARGIRFNLPFAAGPAADAIPRLAARIAPLGWHIQINARAHQWLELENMAGSLPCPLVIDHLGHVPQPEGVAHPAFAVLLRLLSRGRTWVKISGVYIDSSAGAPDYADAGAVVRRLIEAAPDRLVWGSDWPHPSEAVKPETQRLRRLLDEWCADQALSNRILIENPAQLYGFELPSASRPPAATHSETAS